MLNNMVPLNDTPVMTTTRPYLTAQSPLAFTPDQTESTVDGRNHVHMASSSYNAFADGNPPSFATLTQNFFVQERLRESEVTGLKSWSQGSIDPESSSLEVGQDHSHDSFPQHVNLVPWPAATDSDSRPFENSFTNESVNLASPSVPEGQLNRDTSGMAQELMPETQFLGDVRMPYLLPLDVAHQGPVMQRTHSTGSQVSNPPGSSQPGFVRID
jgi:hypothetical protein